MKGRVRTVDSVRTGDRIILRWPEKETETSPLAAKVPVLYEDASLVVFNKPWNMPCHPVKRHQNDTLGNVFAAQGTALPFRPVNRLDKDTTGIVVVAKDPYTASRLARQCGKGILGHSLWLPATALGDRRRSDPPG